MYEKVLQLLSWAARPVAHHWRQPTRQHAVSDSMAPCPCPCPCPCCVPYPPVYAVILCDGCWDMYDHENQRVPLEAPPTGAASSAASPGSGMSPDEREKEPPKCLAGHTMTRNDVSDVAIGLSCDGCTNALGGSFFCCKACDYDLCMTCSNTVPDERSQRSAARTRPADEAVPPPRPKAVRLPSKYQQKRAAAAASKQTTKARQTHTGKRKAARDQLAAVRAKKQAKTHAPKRTRGRSDACGSGGKRAHRS